MWDTALRYLHEAAQYGSMRLAAEKIGVAVSSISRSIAQLEAVYGLPLIEHGRRNIKLTEAGHIALAFYRERVAKQDALLDEFRALRDVKAGRIAISLGEGFLNTALAEFLDGFQARHPSVDMSVMVESTADVITRVIDDEAHLGLVFHSEDSPKVRVRTSVPQPLHLVCPHDHPLATHDRVKLPDLRDYNLCLMPSGYRIRNLIADAEARNRIWLKAGFTTNSMFLMRKLMLSGRAISILPPMAVLNEVESGALVTIPIDEAELQQTRVSLICRLGRRLGGAPLHLLNALESQLWQWTGMKDRLSAGHPS